MDPLPLRGYPRTPWVLATGTRSRGFFDIPARSWSRGARASIWVKSRRVPVDGELVS